MGITESIGVADSEIIEILPESAKYSEKAWWGLHTKQATGDGTKRCWQPAVRCLNSSSAERSLRRFTVRVLQSLGSQ